MNPKWTKQYSDEELKIFQRHKNLDFIIEMADNFYTTYSYALGVVFIGNYLSMQSTILGKGIGFIGAGKIILFFFSLSLLYNFSVCFWKYYKASPSHFPIAIDENKLTKWTTEKISKIPWAIFWAAILFIFIYFTKPY